VFAAEQRGDGRISAYGYDCRRNGFTHIATEASTKPVGITVDDASRSIFWSNDQDYPHGSPTSWASGITYAGKNKRHVLQDIIDPQGLYAEPTHKHLYYTEHSGYKITRSNFDGTNKTVLVSKPGNTSFQPSDVAVDLDAGKLFASVEFPENLQVGYIAMFDIDGTNEQVLVPPPVGRPYGICVDTVHKNLFYIVGGHGGQIRCVSYGKKPCAAEVVQDILEYPCKKSCVVCCPRHCCRSCCCWVVVVLIYSVLYVSYHSFLTYFILF
jgi:DNA-binding beta-propeller fold protein YncE